MPFPPFSNTTGSPTASSGQRANASVKISIPARSTSAGTRSPQYISASTQSMTFSIVDPTTHAATQLASFDLTPTSPGCSAVPAGGTQCVETLGAPEGTDTFQVVAYDQTGGKGNTLSTATVQASLSAGAANSIPLVMDGVAATAQVIVGNANFPVGTTGSTLVTMQAKDAQGNTIVGPGAFSQPFALAVTGDTWSTLKLSQASITKPGEFATLSYNGNSLGGAQITATTSGVTTTPVTVAGLGTAISLFQAPETMDPAWSNWAWYPQGSVAAFADGSAAAVAEVRASFNGTTANPNTYNYDQYGISLISPAGSVTTYVGDVSDPLATPAPSPTPTPGVPPSNVAVVHGMSAFPNGWNGSAASELAPGPAMSHFVAYGAQYNHPVSGPTPYQYQAYDPTVGVNASYDYKFGGSIGKLDTVAHTASEQAAAGSPYYVRTSNDGSVWYVFASSGECNGTLTWDNYWYGWGVPGNYGAYYYNSSPTCTYGTTDSNGNSAYGLGRIDPSGVKTEWSFTQLGIKDDTTFYPNDLAVASDGSAVYVGDDYEQRIIQIPFSGGTPGAPQQVTLARDYALALALDPQNSMLSFSEYTYNGQGAPYFGTIAAGSAFATATPLEFATTSVNNYSYGYSVALADNSLWATDDNATGFYRLSNLSLTAPATNSYVTAAPADYASGYLEGVAVGAGSVWSVDGNYYTINRLTYGAAGANAALAKVRMPASVISANRSTKSVHMQHHLAANAWYRAAAMHHVYQGQALRPAP